MAVKDEPEIVMNRVPTIQKYVQIMPGMDNCFVLLGNSLTKEEVTGRAEHKGQMRMKRVSSGQSAEPNQSNTKELGGWGKHQIQF